MALTCREAARISLATLGGHADEAERLELETHLTRCTRCDEETLWSYRREGKRAGRDLGFIWRRPGG